MLRPFFFAAAVISVIGAFAQVTPAIEWERSLGGSGSDWAYSIVPTSDGGFIVAGFTDSNDGDVTNYHGNRDFWVVKLDATGTIQWQKTLGGSGLDQAYSIDQTSDGGYIVAGVTESNDGDVTNNHGDWDYWVVKLDANGNLQWQKTLGGSAEDYATSIAPTSDGGFIVAGETSSSDGDVTNNHGNGDYWVVKLDATGTMQWQKTLGGSDGELATSVAPTSDEGFIVAGYTSSNDGDVTNHHGFQDFWVVKLDATGTMQWQKTLGGNGQELARSVLPTNDGGYIVAGYAYLNSGDVTNNHGGSDFWVVKLDATGILQWQKSIGGSANDSAESIVPTSNGGYIVAGYTYSTDGDVTNNHGYTDYWLVKLDSTGTLQWQKTMGGSDNEGANSIATTSNGSYILAGQSNSTDGDVTNNNGGLDFWVVKLTDDFNTISGHVFGDLNSNGVHDNGEPLVGQHNVHSVDETRQTWSAADGTYGLTVLDTGTVIMIEPAALLYYVAAPATHSALFNGFQQNDPLNDFAFQPVGVVNDLAVSIAPTTAFRPGFVAQYTIHYQNIGNTVLSPILQLTLDPAVTFNTASLAPTLVNVNSISWGLPPIGPFTEGTILVDVTVNQNAVLGSFVNSPVTIEPIVGDEDASNNNSVWEVSVTGSYDPNDIQVDLVALTPQELLAQPDLNYMIRFQNTGTDTAFTVRVDDVLPADLVFESFDFVNASHPVQIAFNTTTNKLSFQFNNILLPDSNTNEAASHGYVLYRIKPVSTLLVGDSILNQAAIFFDYNAPVITNTAYSVIEEFTTVQTVSMQDGFSISPNPAKGSLVVNAPQATRGTTLTLTDALGRSVFLQTMNSTAHTLDVSQLPRGLYVITLGTAQGNFVERVVLE